jgi:hypothetical protein
MRLKTEYGRIRWRWRAPLLARLQIRRGDVPDLDAIAAAMAPPLAPEPEPKRVPVAPERSRPSGRADRARVAAVRAMVTPDGELPSVRQVMRAQKVGRPAAKRALEAVGADQ